MRKRYGQKQALTPYTLNIVLEILSRGIFSALFSLSLSLSRCRLCRFCPRSPQRERVPRNERRRRRPRPRFSLLLFPPFPIILQHHRWEKSNEENDG